MEVNTHISTTIYGDVARPRSAVFNYFIPIDLVDILVGWGPLPRVVGTSNQTGEWNIIGSSRTVHLADGSTASEQVKHYVQDESFGYTVSKFTNPIRFLACKAMGKWIFNELTPGTTHITWTYTYEAHNKLSAVLLTPIVTWMWKRYMQRAMHTFIAAAEQSINS